MVSFSFFLEARFLKEDFRSFFGLEFPFGNPCRFLIVSGDRLLAYPLPYGKFPSVNLSIDPFVSYLHSPFFT
jgi:hypothetical protein